MDRWMDGWIGGWMDRWMDGQVDGWMGGLMNRWMDRCEVSKQNYDKKKLKTLYIIFCLNILMQFI